MSTIFFTCDFNHKIKNSLIANNLLTVSSNHASHQSYDQFVLPRRLSDGAIWSHPSPTGRIRNHQYWWSRRLRQQGSVSEEQIDHMNGERHDCLKLLASYLRWGNFWFYDKNHKWKKSYSFHITDALSLVNKQILNTQDLSERKKLWY